ncbi:MAG: T9SS type A sorting domain-containing protein [Rhodothermales bacterium]|nr:T9SS type A sorting domain-containing protein [Rhodothermales bacterium]
MKVLLPLVVVFVTLVAPTSAQIRINEVSVDFDFGGQTEWVELYNEGSSAVDVSSWYLCNFPAYPQIGNAAETTVLSGNTTIQPGEYLVLSFAALITSDAEVGVYTTNSNFADPASMVDYMEYGTAGHTRSSVGVSAGVWTAGNTVSLAPAGKTYSWFGGGSQQFDDWGPGEPSPGSANVIATAVDPDIESPRSFTILGNYPNPFNPSTSIVFNLPFSADVSVEVVDILGRTVATAEPRFLQAGDGQSILISGDGLRSGMYIYRVKALSATDELLRTGVMTLLK